MLVLGVLVSVEKSVKWWTVGDCQTQSEREDVLERAVRLLEVFREDAGAELVFGLPLDRAGGAGEV